MFFLLGFLIKSFHMWGSGGPNWNSSGPHYALFWLCTHMRVYTSSHGHAQEATVFCQSLGDP